MKKRIGSSYCRTASTLLLALTFIVIPALEAAANGVDAGLLFWLSADASLKADHANGEAEPNFLSHVRVVDNGKQNRAAQWEDDGMVTWLASSNVYAQRGTVTFYWRSRTPVGEAPFNIFRIGFADHTSWDMAFMRIDWNGNGFDAFVTDTNLARIRVSSTLKSRPDQNQWLLLTFTWDELEGVHLYVDGDEVASKHQIADLDSGLDQFGFAGRIISPHQVQSRYHFMRGSDFDELKIFDHALSTSDVGHIAKQKDIQKNADIDINDFNKNYLAWLRRYGWDADAQVVLDAPSTVIRKVEFSTARDMKEEMRKGIDGIAETTWPGVYNRSRLPGRDDYFELPDWNVYVQGGLNYDLTIPEKETFNRVEIRGAAFGTLYYAHDESELKRNTLEKLDIRKQGTLRSISSFADHVGGILRFSNQVQETPIQEVWAYDVHPGKEPEGTFKLSYKVKANSAPDFPALKSLLEFINGRHLADQRSVAVALPINVRAAPASGSATDTAMIKRSANSLPLVHVLIPASFDNTSSGKPLTRAWNYGWQNAHDGLDGIALDIPALDLPANANGVIPLNIRVKDPIWPARDMMDVSIAVKPREAKTVWLDLRDRILTDKSFYFTIASSNAAFNAESLDGMNIRLIFKDREIAKREHIEDRFNQVKDNWGFLVEEHTATRREALYERVLTDITDLLAVDPENEQARIYWQDISYFNQSMPPYQLSKVPAGVPEWAHRQLEDLKLTRKFVNWWIDNRQVEYGDFGGGISDDTDLTQQWPGLALMGVDVDKINNSLRALSDAVYKNGMMVNGLGYITTDELHAYEEGMNSDAQRLYLNWGEPKALERMMATVKRLQDVIQVNPAGHMHFASDWYGARKMYRETPWQWQKPYSFTVLHAPILLGLYNSDPSSRHLVTGVINGLLAHAKQDAAGNWKIPNEINWATDAERAGDGGGISTPLQAAWAAYRFTEKDDYLRPLRGVLATRDIGLVAELNENVIDSLNMHKEWSDRLARMSKEGNSFDQYVRWQLTGDKQSLVNLHENAIREKSQRMYMYTEGHRWTDRVEMATDVLQRERLGGVALIRNLTYPGHTVSWKFSQADGAVQVAILVKDATPTHFKVIAYNTSDTQQHAVMTTWNVRAGNWSVRRGVDANGDDMADSPITSTLTLARSKESDVAFEPLTTTVLEYTLISADDIQPERRADFGIGIDDVVVKKNALDITVHSLGALSTGKGTVSLVDASGHILATAAVSPLPAPLDLQPKAMTVRIKIPRGVSVELLSVAVETNDHQPEVTNLNNKVNLRDVIAKHFAYSR